MRPWLTYTGLRLVLFAGVAAGLLVVGVEGFPMLLTSLLVSSILSLFVLRPQRDAVVAAQEAKAQRRAEEREHLRARLDDDPS